MTSGEHDAALQRIWRDRTALAAMDRSWHAAQRRALDHALEEVRGSGWVDCLGRRGEQLLVVLRHAAALAELPPGTVAGWVHAQDIAPALAILRGPLSPRVQALLQTPLAVWPAVWAVAGRLATVQRQTGTENDRRDVSQPPPTSEEDHGTAR